MHYMTGRPQRQATPQIHPPHPTPLAHAQTHTHSHTKTSSSSSISISLASALHLISMDFQSKKTASCNCPRFYWLAETHDVFPLAYFCAKYFIFSVHKCKCGYAAYCLDTQNAPKIECLHAPNESHIHRGSGVMALANVSDCLLADVHRATAARLILHLCVWFHRLFAIRC